MRQSFATQRILGWEVQGPEEFRVTFKKSSFHPTSIQHYLGPFRPSVEIKTSRLLPFLFSSKFSDSEFCPPCVTAPYSGLV